MTATILRRRALAEDEWTLVESAAAQPGSEGASEPRESAGKVIVPLGRWRTERERLLATATAVGVLLPNTEDVETIWPEIRDRPLLALQFPIFTDGRALTQAVLLRNRLGFAGELRAVGDVIRDLVFWLGRCGFDSIVPRGDQSLEACRLALDELSVAYQPAADGREPVWVKRRERLAFR